MTSATLVTPARADPPAVAVLVGVDHYKNVPNHDLSGCVDDMKDLGDALKGAGFTPNPLGDASSKDITNVLDTVEASAQSGQRFVFYFSGHGTNDANAKSAGICPTDFAVGGTNEITMNDLDARFQRMAAKGCVVTVLLDCCFAGSIQAVADSGAPTASPPPAKFIPPKFTGKDPAPFDPDDPVNKKGPVCYVTACQANQTSLNLKTPDLPRVTGPFTHCLIDEIKKAQSAPVTWQKALSDVQLGVETLEESASIPPSAREEPRLSPGWASAEMFKQRTDAAPSPKTAADDFTIVAPDPDTLEATFTPNGNDPIVPGQILSLQINAKKPGFVVVMGEYAGHFYRMYPDSVNPSSWKRNAGVPSTKEVVMPYNTGNERVKAIWFRDWDSAAALIGALPIAGRGSTGLSFSDLQKKDIGAVSDGPAIATEDFSYKVRDGLLGGGYVKSASKVFSLLVQDSSPQILWRMALGETLLKKLGVDSSSAKPIGPVDAAECLLNYLIQLPTLYNEEALKGRAVGDDVLAELKEYQSDHTKTEQLLRANRALVSIVFGDAINLGGPTQ